MSSVHVKDTDNDDHNDHLIMSGVAKKKRHLTEEEEEEIPPEPAKKSQDDFDEDNEPVDVSAQQQSFNGKPPLTLGGKAGNGYDYSSLKRVKRRKEDRSLVAPQTESVLSEKMMAIDHSETSKPPSNNKKIPPRPSWMPEEIYQKRMQSVEVLTSPKETTPEVVKPKSAPVAKPKPKPEVIRPRLDQNSLVRNFYNDQTYRSKREKRTKSRIYRIRSFNNCIKYILINKYATEGGNVLDIGCGKGGDIAKWEMARIGSYVGIDISDESIREAIRRYRRRRCSFRAIFATGDGYTKPVPEILADFSDIDLSFDTVSLQFCFHYAFADEKTARGALENISRSLKMGGMFIGTMPSSDFIRWKIRRLKPGSKGWSNSLYSVEFDQPPPKDGNFKTAFGNKYTYYLADAVDHVPEYVVPFEKLRSLCEEYNMELRYKRNLIDVFKREIPNYFDKLPRPIIESLKRSNGTYGISGEDREACSFYLAFAFEKTS